MEGLGDLEGLGEGFLMVLEGFGRVWGEGGQEGFLRVFGGFSGFPGILESGGPRLHNTSE